MVLKRFFICCILISSFCALGFAADIVRVKKSPQINIIGKLDKEVKNNIEKTLKSYDLLKFPDDLYKIDSYQLSVVKLTDKALRAFGYYNSKIIFEGLDLKIETSAPVVIRNTNIDVLGQGQKDSDLLQTIEQYKAKKGEQLNHQKYDRFKWYLKNVTAEKGYFDATFLKKQLAVYPKLKNADWNVVLDTGNRYKFGEILLEHSRLDDGFINNIIKFNSDAPYLNDDLLAISERLNRSNYFQNVFIEPISDRETKRVDLKVKLLPKKRNQMKFTLGYNSSVGFHASSRWIMPYVNRYGHHIATGISINKKRKQFDFQYNLPVYSDPLNNLYVFSADIETKSSKFWGRAEAFNLNLSAHRHFRLDKPFSFNLGANIEVSKDKKVENGRVKTLFYPSIVLRYKKSDGLVFPLNGHSLSIASNFSTNFLGSSGGFAHFSLDATVIRTIKESHRFLNRISLGYVYAKDFLKLPSKFRFFAGGDNSIRGFKFNSVGGKEGGNLMGTFSSEYQYKFSPTWWGSLFVDLGSVSQGFKPNFKIGGGAGVRYISPIGAIKVDVAFPFNEKRKGFPFEIYVGFGVRL